MLAVAEWLPASVQPLYPTYLKLFCCQSLAALVALGLLVGALARTGRVRLGEVARLRHTFPLALGFCLLWAALSALWSPWPAAATAYVVRELTFLLLAFLCFAALSDRRHWRTFACAFFLAALVAAAWQGQHILRAAVAGGERETLNTAFFKRPFLYGNMNFCCAPVVCGGLLAVAFALARLKAARSQGGEGLRSVSLWVYLVGTASALVVFVFLLMAADSLAGYVAAFVGVCAYVLCMLPVRRRGRVAAIVVASLLIAAVAALYVPGIRDRAVTRLLERDSTAKARIVWWMAAGDMFSAKPMAGWGVGAYGSAYYRFAPVQADESHYTRWTVAAHPHNEFLRVGAETGLIGLVGYLVLLASALVPSCRLLGRQEFGLRSMGYALWAGALAYVVQAALGKAAMSWDFALGYWLLLGVLASAARWRRGAAPQQREAARLGPRGRLIVAAGAVAVAAIWQGWALRPYRAMVKMRGAEVELAALDGRLPGAGEEGLSGDQMAAAMRHADRAEQLLSEGEQDCLWPTRVLRDRFALGSMLVELGRWRRATAHLEWVQAAAPGAIRTEYLLARCRAQGGDHESARALLIGFLEHHPRFTPAYAELAALDPRLATSLLLEQIAARDRYADAPRLAMAGRILVSMGKWDVADALLGDALERGGTEAARALAGDMERFCEQRGLGDKLQPIREKYPSLFTSEH